MKKLLALLFVIFIFTGNVIAQKKTNKSKKPTIASILKGSKKSQRVQNQEANREGLSRIKNDKQLIRMETNGYLVPITSSVNVNPRLKKKYRYVRPWANRFMKDIQSSFLKKFHKKLKISSAVRTEEYQKKLRKRNSNAVKVSTHPTGSTVDVVKRNLTASQKQWVRKYLADYELKNMIEATEEQKQKCFHFFIFENYRR